MKILVDAMGGDNAPLSIVEGCVDALKENIDLNIALYGDSNKIESILKKYQFDSNRIELIHTSEEISGHDIPTKAIRQKKDSSLVVGLKDLKRNAGDVFVSCGNTGAVMTGALLGLGRMKGVLRPALTSMIPTKKNLKILLDVGANTICKPQNYVDFAILGSLYMEHTFNIKKPKVGLLNIGSEDSKGNSLIKEAYNLLSKSNINFIGNIEGKDVLSGNIDVIVTDGFNGNILLKFLEGVGDFVFSELKQVFTTSIFTKMSALLLKNNLRKFKNKMDYAEYGGVPLLGVNGKVLKAHGGSNRKAVKNLILNGYRYANQDIDLAKAYLEKRL